MLKRRDHAGGVRAYDERGHAWDLDVYVDVIDAGDSDDPHAEAVGPAAIQTAGGQPVHRLEKGRYRLIISGKLLHSDDPDAP
jgi:hypothetical protein